MAQIILIIVPNKKVKKDERSGTNNIFLNSNKLRPVSYVFQNALLGHHSSMSLGYFDNDTF